MEDNNNISMCKMYTQKNAGHTIHLTKEISEQITLPIKKHLLAVWDKDNETLIITRLKRLKETNINET